MPTPVPVHETSLFKRVLQGIRAAVTTPDAVKQEKSLAIIIATRLLLAAGATDGVVQLVEAIIKQL